MNPLLDQLRQEHFGADNRGHWELQALDRIHLYSREDLGISGGGDIREVIILATVACLILLVACLNYANLGTALAAQRVREIGLRLSMGAGRSQLARQFLIESAVVTSLAFAVAVVLANTLAPHVTRFGGMALLVACVGMFGLASFAAQRRRMEFGVRKVLGATGIEIGRLLAGELTRLVLVASLLACPIAYFGMAAWMEQFSERAEVGAGPFVAAVAAALVAAWVSVAYHAIRTSRTDPVEALRCE